MNRNERNRLADGIGDVLVLIAERPYWEGDACRVLMVYPATDAGWAAAEAEADAFRRYNPTAEARIEPFAVWEEVR